MLKAIEVKDSIMVNIDTQILNLSIKETFNEIYHNPESVASFKGACKERLYFVLEKTNEEVRIKDEWFNLFRDVLIRDLAREHEHHHVYSYVDADGSYISYDSVGKELIEDYSFDKPIDRKKSDSCDAVIDLASYVSLNYMKNIGRPMPDPDYEMTRSPLGIDHVEKALIKEEVFRDAYYGREVYYSDCATDEYEAPVRLRRHGFLIMDDEDGVIRLHESNHKYYWFCIEYWLSWRLGFDKFNFKGIYYKLEDIRPTYDDYADYRGLKKFRQRDGWVESVVIASDNNDFRSNFAYLGNCEFVFKLAQSVSIKYIRAKGLSSKRCISDDLLEMGTDAGELRVIPKVLDKNYGLVQWLAHLDVPATVTKPTHTQVWNGICSDFNHKGLARYRVTFPDYWILEKVL